MIAQNHRPSITLLAPSPRLHHHQSKQCTLVRQRDLDRQATEENMVAPRDHVAQLDTPSMDHLGHPTMLGRPFLTTFIVSLPVSQQHLHHNRHHLQTLPYSALINLRRLLWSSIHTPPKDILHDRAVSLLMRFRKSEMLERDMMATIKANSQRSDNIQNSRRSQQDLHLDRPQVIMTPTLIARPSLRSAHKVLDMGILHE